MTEHELFFAQLEAQRNALRQAKRQLWLGGVAVWLVMLGIVFVWWGLLEVL